MIKARCPRRFFDKPAVCVQLIEPQTLLFNRKKPNQGCDGAGNLGLVPALDEIGSNSLRLSPEPRDRIVHAAVDQHGVDGNPSDRIDPMSIREGDEP
jgi:hypothetical protein